MQEQIEEWFDQADQLLFTDAKYDEAHKLYNKILEQEPDNVDAINSITYCIKFKAGDKLSEANFNELVRLHEQVLKIDEQDIEANFNMGLLFLQDDRDLTKALKYFSTSVAKDNSSN